MTPEPSYREIPLTQGQFAKAQHLAFLFVTEHRYTPLLRRLPKTLVQQPVTFVIIPPTMVNTHVPAVLVPVNPATPLA